VTHRLTSGIVYGPVQSRRFGLSLGINLLGTAKRCNFDCRYCYRGPNRAGTNDRLPNTREVIEAVDAWLVTSDRSSDLDDVTLAGNGEPTMHPELDGIVEALVRWRDRHLPKVKISILTNGMGLLPRINAKCDSVRRALGRADRSSLKLDAGTEAIFARLSRPAAGVTLAEWLKTAEGVRPLMLQTMLVTGEVDNSGSDDVDALCAAYVHLRPSVVHLLTVDKPTADESVRPVAAERLAAVAATVEQALGSIGCAARVVVAR
jgi:wyosine [tRNA(Phe)-imidazoG37] synthetase (radical SAM superfamily)